MNTADIIYRFEEIFSKEEVSLLLSSLRQDNLIWNEVQNHDLLNDFVSNFKSDFTKWNPANIALYLIDKDIVISGNSCEYIFNNTKTINYSVERLYKFNKSEIFPLNIKDAGFIAIGIYQLYQKYNSWNKVLNQLNICNNEQFNYAIKKWGNVFGILFGMINDPAEIIEFLSKNCSKTDYSSIIVQMVLCNPMTNDSYECIFTNAMEDLELNEKICFIQMISDYGRKIISSKLASNELNSLDTKVSDIIQGTQNINDELNNTLHLNHIAELFFHSGDDEKAKSLKKRAGQILKTWVNELDPESYEDSGIINEEIDLENTSDSENYNTLEISDSPKIKNSGERVNIERYDHLKEDLRTIIKKALRLLEYGNCPDAIRLAKLALGKLLNEIISTGVFSSRSDQKYVNAHEIVFDLKKLGLYNEALEIALSQVKIHPNRTELLYEISKLLERLGDLENAVNYGKLAQNIEPNNVEYLRWLANLWEINEQYDKSFDTWILVNEVNKTPEIYDLLELAKSCLKNEQIVQAIDICNEILRSEPENGSAFLLIGQANMILGKWGEVFENLQRATQYSPNDQEAWLLLSGAYLGSDHKKQAIETLYKARKENPNSSKILFKLIEELLKNGNIVEGLNIFDDINKLNLETQEEAIGLIKLLRKLNLYKEAKELINRLQRSWPDNTSLGQEYAKVSIALGEFNLELLSNNLADQKVMLDDEFIEEFLKYLFASMNTLDPELEEQSAKEYSIAQSIINKIIDQNPIDVRAKTLLAELLLCAGKAEDSFEVYQKLVGDPNIQKLGLAWRLQVGLAKSARELGESETAKKAAKQAYLEKNDNVAVLKMYVATHNSDNNYYEVLGAVEKIQKSPDSKIRDLLFAAEACRDMAAYDQTMNILDDILNKSNNNPDAIVLMAEILYKTGDTDKATNEIKGLLSQNDLVSKDFVNASYIFDLLNKPQESLECLKKVENLDQSEDLNLLLKITNKLNELGEYKEALSYINKSLDRDISNQELYKIKSELLLILDDPSEALFEFQVHRIKNKQRDDDNIDISTNVQDPLSYQVDKNCDTYLARNLYLLINSGNSKSALNFIKNNFDSITPDYDFEQLSNHLSTTMLNDKVIEANAAKRIKGIERELKNPGEESNNHHQKTYISYIEKQVDNALRQGNEVEAGRIVEKACNLVSYNSALFALQARMVARQGNYKLANELFNQAKELRVQAQTNNAQPKLPVGIIKELKNKVDSYQDYLFSQTALECMLWDEAYEYIDTFLNSNPHEILPYLQKARVIVTIKEMHMLCNELECKNNSPTSQVLNACSYEEFSEAITQAKIYQDSEEIQCLFIRGLLCFGKNKNDGEKYLGYKDNRENLGWLSGLIRIADNIELLSKLFSEYPNNPIVYINYLLAVADAKYDKNLDPANNNITYISDSNPLVLTALSKAYQNHDVKSAFKFIEAALSLWPNEPEWNAIAARLAILNNDNEKGLVYWNKAIKLEPDNELYLKNLANIYIQENNIENAISTINYAIQLNNNQELNLLLAEAYAKDKQYQKAISAIKEIKNKDKFKTEINILYSDIYSEIGEKDKAYNYSKNAYKSNPHNINAIMRIVKIYEERNEMENALSIIDKSINLSSNEQSVVLIKKKIQLLKKVSDPKSLLSVIEDLIEKYPNDPDILFHLAETQYECNDEEKALENFRNALTKTPNNSDTHFMIGKLLINKGQLDQAIFNLSDAIRIDPKNIDAYLELGEAYQKRREYEKAFHVYEQAIFNNPDDFRPYYKLAVIQRESKDFTKSEINLRKALYISPENIAIRRQLGAVIALNLVHNPQEVIA